MNNLKKIAAVAALAVSLCSVAISQEQMGENNRKSTQANGKIKAGKPDFPPPMSPRGGFHPRMLEKLDLTTAQKEQIQVLMENNRAASPEQFDKVRTIDEQLQTIVQANNFNEEQARQLLAAKAEASIELEIARLKTDSAIYNILTAEQKARLAQLKEERPEFGPRGGMRRNDPPPQN